MDRPSLTLASESPRRRELLGHLGVPFEVAPAAIDERRAVHPAAAKAEAVVRRGTVTLAADTMIQLDGDRIGKPEDAEDAVRMLRRLRAREHVVRTEVALIDATGQSLRFAVRSRVRLRAVDDRAIEDYVATGEPLDKAGAYAIQGVGAALVERYDGCYANVIGLPLCHAYFALRRAGVVSRDLPESAFARAFGFPCPARHAAARQGRFLYEGAEYDTAASA